MPVLALVALGLTAVWAFTESARSVPSSNWPGDLLDATMRRVLAERYGLDDA